MKKVISVLLAMVMIFALAACGGGSNEPATGGDEGGSDGGSVAVFYYTFGDTYISSVRAALDSALSSAGVNYQDFDGNNSQTTQTEQVQTAIASGATLLVVNLVDSGSDDAASNLVDLAKNAGIPIIFFNRSVSESVVAAYDQSVFVGTDYEMAGHMQGKMIGEYLLDNYDTVDLNGDGTISYVMLKGDEGNAEAIARTKYGQEDADAVLTAAGKPALSFYDAGNSNKYLLDQTGSWSAAQGNELMQTVLSQYSEANGNMVEVIIANNDDMALGAISALQNVGYNSDGATVIPVFGVDATDSAKDAIAAGSMTGTIKQDAEGMANTIAQIVQNYIGGADAFSGVDSANVVGTWRVNIPYATYTGE